MESGRVTLELLLGALLVMFHAYERFNNPATNRSSTTAVHYFSGATVYAVIALCAYFILSNYRDLLVNLLGKDMVPDYVLSLSPALIAALVLSVFVEKIPFIAYADRRLRSYLQEVAQIPYEVRRLSHALRSYEFSVSKPMLDQVRSRLGSFGLKEEDLVWDHTESFQPVWAKTTVLLQLVAAWQTERRFSAFMSTYKNDYAALAEKHARLNTYVLDYKLSAHAPVDTPEEVLIQKLRKYVYEDQLKDLFQEVCDFIARAMLSCHVSAKARTAELRRMGFGERREPHQLSLNQMANIFLMVGAVLLTGILFSGGRKDFSFGQQMMLVLMVATTYCVAISCAIYFMRQLEADSVESVNERHTITYLFAGLVAVVLGLLVHFIFKFLIHDFNLEATLQDIGVRYPWLLLTFTLAAMTAFNIDNGSDRGRAQAWVEGGLQALGLGIAAYVAYLWVRQINPQIIQNSSMVWRVILISAVNGFLLGYNVPRWYRGKQQHRLWNRRGTDAASFLKHPLGRLQSGTAG